jgi:hypothetical protein
MSTKTEIANVALKALGEPRVDNIEQETKRARSLKAVYNVVRRAVLREHPWNFAKQYKRLAASATTTGWKWAYEHPLPADFLRMVDVEGLDGQYEIFRVPGVGRVLACNSSPINITFIGDVTVEAEFDASFVDAFALKLAARTAVDITGSNTLSGDCDAQYERQLRRARGVDAQENGQDEIQDGGGWNAARN